MISKTPQLLVYVKPDHPRFLNMSPFCAKSEYLFKLAGISVEIEIFKGNPKSLPKEKLPVLRVGSEVIADSWFIQDYVKKHLASGLDSNLTPVQLADSWNLTRMTEEFLYWAIVRERWLVDENWKGLVRAYFGSIPALIRGPVTALIRSGVKKAVWAQGLGRHSHSELISLSRHCLESLSFSLGDKPFFMGETPSTVDTTMAAFVSNLIHCNLNPELTGMIGKFSNLVDYDERIHQLWHVREPV